MATAQPWTCASPVDAIEARKPARNLFLFRGRVAALLTILSVAGLASLAVALTAKTIAPAALTGSLEAIHGFISSGVRSGFVLIAMVVLSLIASQFVFLFEIAHKIGVGAAMLGSLAFAQISDSGAGASKILEVDAPTAPRSEFQAALYLGGSIAAPSDVILKAPDDTDATLKNVRWWSESLIDSPYYGVRGIKWAETNPSLGTMVDYTHTKATAYEQKVKQSGKVKGKVLPPEGKFEDTFRKLEYTHGLNQLTMNGVFRLTRLHPRIRPYFGLGLGVMVPHVDSQRAGFPRKTRTLGPQITGPVFQVLGGVEWRIFASNRVSAITEYKLAHSRNMAKLRTGGTAYTEFWISQIIVGLTRYVWRAAPAVAN